MSGLSLDELHQEWLKRLGYKVAYTGLEEEFAVASALIDARPGGPEPKASAGEIQSLVKCHRNSGRYV